MCSHLELLLQGTQPQLLPKQGLNDLVCTEAMIH